MAAWGRRGVNGRRLPADRRLQAERSPPRDELSQVVGALRVALVERLGQQLGVSVGAEQELGLNSTDGTSAMTHSSKPGRSSRPLCATGTAPLQLPPTSTVLFKAIVAANTRSAIIFRPSARRALREIGHGRRA